MTELNLAQEVATSTHNSPFRRPLDLSLHEFLISSGASIRASNATNGSMLRVADYFDTRKRFLYKLSRTKNIGKKTVVEIVNLIETSPMLQCDIESASGPLSSTQTSPDQPKAGVAPLQERIACLYLNKLSERSREVLSLRGAMSDEAMTLEEIGAVYELTRERIRQIEKKAKRTMSALLMPYQAQIIESWIDAFPSNRIGRTVSKDKLTSLMGQTPIYIRLALFCLDITPMKILGDRYRVYESGWLVDCEMYAAVERLEQFLRLWSDTATPTPISQIANSLKLPVEDISALLHIHGRFQEYRGYLIKRPAYRRIKRTVDLHYMLSTKRANGPCPLPDLIFEYLASHPETSCSTRDALVVMSDQGKSLFLNCYEYGWYPLPPYPEGEHSAFPYPISDQVTATLSSDCNESSELAENFETLACEIMTIENQLEEILADGPMSFDDLRNAFVKREHPGARNSVGPIIIGSGKFARVAPGVYALTEKLNDPETILLGQEILLSEKHCRLYCQARWAGESSDLYPCWGATIELKWAMLFADLEDSTVFSSLMSVASIGNWPIPVERREYWGGLQNRAAKYLLGEPPIEFDPFAYTVRQIVTASVHAVSEGRTSWIACNRAIGKRIDDRHVSSLLAILIKMCIIHGASHWQASHKALPNACSIVEKMLAVLATHPDIGFPEFLRELGIELSDANDGVWLTNTQSNQSVKTFSSPSRTAMEIREPPFQNLLPLSDLSAQILRMRRRRKI